MMASNGADATDMLWLWRELVFQSDRRLEGGRWQPTILRLLIVSQSYPSKRP